VEYTCSVRGVESKNPARLHRADLAETGFLGSVSDQPALAPVKATELERQQLALLHKELGLPLYPREEA